MSSRNSIHTLRDKNHSKKARNRTQGRKLLLEQLEDRRVLAAMVWVDGDFHSGTSGWGTTHFDSIQQGINAVDPTGTVNVAAGTYSELLTINKAVSLLGAQAAVKATGRSARAVNRSSTAQAVVRRSS
jgi:hypothetical protein